MKRISRRFQLFLFFIFFLLIFNEFFNTSVDEKNFQNTTEWIGLDDTLYIRTNSVFYFSDEAYIKAFAVLASPDLVELKATLFIHKRKIESINCLLNKYIDANFYGSYSIDCPVSTKLKNEYQNSKLNIIFHNLKTNSKTKSPLRVHIKSLEDRKDAVAICIRPIYLNDELINDFRIWLDINRYANYSKIVIYDNLIPPKIHRMLRKRYKGFIETRPYRTIASFNSSFKPVFLDNFFNCPRDEIIAHDRLVINECYASLIKDYSKVAVLDLDELLLPNGYAKPREKYPEEIYSILASKDTSACKYDILEYLDGIKSLTRMPESVSFWFGFGWAIDKEFLENIFKAVKTTIDEKANLNLKKFDVEVIK